MKERRKGRKKECRKENGSGRSGAQAVADADTELLMLASPEADEAHLQEGGEKILPKILPKVVRHQLPSHRLNKMNLNFHSLR